MQILTHYTGSWWEKKADSSLRHMKDNKYERNLCDKAGCLARGSRLSFAMIQWTDLLPVFWLS